MDGSESSTTEGQKYLDAEEKNVQILASQMLKTRIFLGHFQERRLVEPLRSYRDVIVVADSEAKLKNAIDVVRKRLREFYGSDYWIGLTGPDFAGAPSGYCIWTESLNGTFGRYWYKIKDVRFRRKEIFVKLKVLREVNDEDVGESTSINNLSNLMDTISMDDVKSNISHLMYLFFTQVLTGRNLLETFKFLSILFATFITCGIKGIAFLMEFLLRFIREISVLINATTPVIIAIVHFFEKVVGGFYYLIAMMWKDSTESKSYVPSYETISATNYRPIEYRPSYETLRTTNRLIPRTRRGVIITEVD